MELLMTWQQGQLLGFRLFFKFQLQSHIICQDAQWAGYIKILRMVMQVMRIPNDLMGAVWVFPEADGYEESHFLHQGGVKHKQSPGIAKIAVAALSSALHVPGKLS